MTQRVNRPAWSYYLGEYPRQIWLMVGLLCLAGLVESVGAVSVVPLLSALFGSGPGSSPAVEKINRVFVAVGITPTVPALLGVICAAIVVKALLSLLAYQRTGYVVADVVQSLRVGLMDGLLKARWPFYVSQETGRLTLALSSEASQAGMALRCFAQFLSCVLQAVSYLLAAAFLSWTVLLAGLAVGGVFVFAFKGTVSLVKRAGERRSRATNAMIAVFTDALLGTKPLKVMGVGREFMGYVHAQAERCRKADRQYVLGVGFLTTIQEPVLTIILCLGIYVAMVHFTVDATFLLGMAFFFHRIVSRLSGAQQYWQIYQGQEGVLSSLMDKMEQVAANREQFRGLRRVEMQQGVVLRDVDFSYGDRAILKGCNLSVPARSLIALYGPSGTGKTTVADMIAGLVSPDRGEVLVDGVPLTEMDVEHWRRQIGYVPQEVFLFHNTVRNNIAMGREYSDREILEALEKAGARSFVDQLEYGLDTTVGEHGRMLSGGQRQRLMIARAIVSKPKLLVLDEATTGLDSVTEKGIMRAIEAMKEDMSILAISHQEAVKEIADTVLEFKEGAMHEG